MNPTWHYYRLTEGKDSISEGNVVVLVFQDGQYRGELIFDDEEFQFIHDTLKPHRQFTELTEREFDMWLKIEFLKDRVAEMKKLLDRRGIVV